MPGTHVLVPPQTPKLPFDVIVTTCLEYAPKTLPALLDTMKASGVPLVSVHVVVGQCPAGRPECIAELEREGAKVTTVPYGAEALTGAVACARGDVSTTPWFLMIQDTCFVGPGFVKLASEVHDRVRDTDDFDVVKLLDKFSLSIGFYRTTWLASKAADLDRVRIESFDVDSIRRLKMFVEDVAFDMADPARTAVLGRFDDRALVGNFKYPGSDTDRVVEHYPSLDIYKVKSSIGQRVQRYTTTKGDDVLRIPVGP